MKMISNIFSRLHIEARSNLPIFAQLHQQIAWLIASGELKPGDFLPSIRELGAALGIHWHTVRQAYLALESDGLVETRRKRGTQVIAFDLSRLTQPPPPSLPSHTIGLLIPSTDPFYDPFLDGLEETARHAFYMLMVCYTRDQEKLTHQHARQLLAKNVDGLIAVSPVAGVLEGVIAPAKPTPIVYVDAPQFAKNSILLDLENSGYEAARHLIQHGHKRVGLITAPLSWPNFHECYVGYKRALENARIRIETELIIESPAYAIESGYQSALKMLDLKQPPTAIFVAGDLLSVGVMRAIRDRGKRIPQDIAIASKDNIQLAALIDPPLTTVASPTYQMGVDAMTMLTQLMEGKRLKKSRVILHTELVIRKSCGCNR